MRPLRITAITATSAMGTGLAAMHETLASRRAGLAPCDLPGMPDGVWVGRVREAEALQPPAPLAAFACRNTRLAELALRQDGFMEAVAAAVARHGAGRIAVVLGTSTSGIEETEQAWARRGQDGALPPYDFARTHDLHALPRYVRARLGLRGPCIPISTACTSGARAFLDAATLIAAGVADAAIVGGADTLCRLTLHGFASLELLAKGPTRPCAEDRDGISIGEAAAFALLERAGPEDAGRIGLLGVGASSDGHHMSSPHPEGLGAVTAMRAALDSAGIAPAAIDYVNMHGTGTRANDAMEDRAIARLFGDAVPCSSTKGWTGHTLGASGALEAAVAAVCIQAGLVPGCLGLARPDPSFVSGVVVENRATRVDRALSNSFGFGGSNCALVIGRIP
ncbi:beta-ketoacyl-[acyl-carrier-protein] synthase family protein [Roseomonas eburnea]|uniref:Beta-ketoacyl-[acyl-carrier-protein] synthase family protein n=1 Tax=Neoroseomonas eburnea TaxID=1346889 RepID=A0A9X9XG91_9PROT|nr:beta-ketoacyl-[acyl-carrier-protein] synthase family protein [Neoroseomonas eburnea]MBR0682727.1 beta-ketoacyl-[acyl-carrier-protein] synthase family protein [Neoroseomonas eburnea]